MTALISGILSLLWVVIGYFSLLWLAKRFFSGRFRAQTAAAAVVIAFTIGANWPHAGRASDVVTASPSIVPAAAVAPATPNPGIEVGSACSHAHLTSPAGKGHVDTASVQRGSAVVSIGPNDELQPGDVVVAHGWAANARLQGSATAVCLVVDGKLLSGVKILYGGNRPDVAAAFNSAALMATGYEITLPIARILPGPHRIQVAAVAAGGSATLTPGDIRVTAPRSIGGS